MLVNDIEKSIMSVRQRKALIYIKEHGQITNKIYQEINAVSKPSATLDLRDLSDKKLIVKKGTTGRGTFYILAGEQVKG